MYGRKGGDARLEALITSSRVAVSATVAAVEATISAWVTSVRTAVAAVAGTVRSALGTSQREIWARGAAARAAVR